MSEQRIDDAGVAGSLHDDGAACGVEHLEWGGTWPDRAQFHRLADAGYRVVPIVRRLLADSLTPVAFTSVSPGPFGNVHSGIGGIRRFLEPIQLHRRQFDSSTALRSRQGELARPGAGRSAH